MKTPAFLALAWAAFAVPASVYPHDAIQVKEAIRDFGTDRIIQGNKARKGQFPYQAALVYTSYEGNNLLCGGSIIGAKWILTAAHCLEELSSGTVYVGTNDIAIRREKGRQEFFINNTHVHIHPGYNFPYYDVGLLELPSEIRFTNYVAKVRLATSSTSSVGKPAIISGFGAIRDKPSPVLTLQLRYTDKVKIVDSKMCQSEYDDLPYREGIICAKADGFGEQSSCKGDSGGPLFIPDDAGWTVQLGIASFVHSTGCLRRKPFGYSSVPAALPWIEEVTGLTFD